MLRVQIWSAPERNASFFQKYLTYGIVVVASQRGSARLLLATSSENPYRRLVSFYPDGRGKRRAHPYVVRAHFDERH